MCEPAALALRSKKSEKKWPLPAMRPSEWYMNMALGILMRHRSPKSSSA